MNSSNAQKRSRLSLAVFGPHPYPTQCTNILLHVQADSFFFVIFRLGYSSMNLNVPPCFSLGSWTHKLGNREFAEKELERAFSSWAPYAKLNFVKIDDYHQADIRILFGRYNHGDASVYILCIRFNLIVVLQLSF